MCIIGISEGRRSKTVNEMQEKYKNIIAKNIPKLVSIKPQI